MGQNKQSCLLFKFSSVQNIYIINYQYIIFWLLTFIIEQMPAYQLEGSTPSSFIGVCASCLTWVFHPNKKFMLIITLLSDKKSYLV